MTAVASAGADRRLQEAVAGSGAVGVAVSGGGDSMALLHLMVARRAGTVLAVSVNHRLRPEAAAECAMVARVCASLGVAHSTLVWEHGPHVSGNLMAEASRARYRLIAAWARAAGVGEVALGHTADDQAETFLMGLARGAGLDGLAGMRARWEEGGITWSRPLLGHTRAALRAYLARIGAEWVEDPTNDDARYTRVQARRALGLLRPLGITVERLRGTIANLALSRRAAHDAMAALAARIVREEAGGLLIERAGFLAAGDESRRLLIIAALLWVSGAAHAPRAPAVMRLLGAMAEERDATLWGCRIRQRGESLQIWREPHAVAGIAAPPDQPWDGRWLLEGPGAADLQVRCLGAAGLRLCPTWRATGLCRDALLVSPALWRGDALISAPIAGYGNGWKARTALGFGQFILSH